MTNKSQQKRVRLQRGASVVFKSALGDLTPTAEHTPRYFSPQKCVALFLCISQVLVGSPAYPSEIPKTALLNPPGIQVEFKIPARLGNLEEFHTALCPETASKANCTAKTVIYIQDAHDSLEAQENIAKLIHTLVAKYGVKTVLEEGYEGPVPTDKYFGTIQDPKVRQKVAYFLMDKFRLGGAEYAHNTRFD